MMYNAETVPHSSEIHSLNHPQFSNHHVNGNMHPPLILPPHSLVQRSGYSHMDQIVNVDGNNFLSHTVFPDGYLKKVFPDCTTNNQTNDQQLLSTVHGEVSVEPSRNLENNNIRNEEKNDDTNQPEKVNELQNDYRTSSDIDSNKLQTAENVKESSDFMSSDFNSTAETLEVIPDIGNQSSISLTSQNYNIAVSSDNPPINDGDLYVPTSTSNNKKICKQYFCIFCQTLQTKFARHLEIKHKDESRVIEFMQLPKGSSDRNNKIEKIRCEGTFLHNTSAELNTGYLITRRRPQEKYSRSVKDFVCCGTCGNFFSKVSFRIHRAKCDPNHKKGKRGGKVEGVQPGFCHPRANNKMRSRILPNLKGDGIGPHIHHDLLLILFGNELCERYALDHEEGKIRNYLRLMSRLKIVVEKINPNITDVSSFYNPQALDSVVKGIREVAEFNERTNTYKIPYNATTLPYLIKTCGKVLLAESIKNQDEEIIKNVTSFFVRFDDKRITVINQDFESQSTQSNHSNLSNQSNDSNQHQENPTGDMQSPIAKSDIKILCDYVKNRCDEAVEIAENDSSFAAWSKLSEACSFLLQVVNSHRSSEMEKMIKQNHQSNTNDKNISSNAISSKRSRIGT